jgi:hypothetical protein
MNPSSTTSSFDVQTQLNRSLAFPHTRFLKKGFSRKDEIVDENYATRKDFLGQMKLIIILK